jgi:hypothetical protein
LSLVWFSIDWRLFTKCLCRKMRFSLDGDVFILPTDFCTKSFFDIFKGDKLSIAFKGSVSVAPDLPDILGPLTQTYLSLQLGTAYGLIRFDNSQSGCTLDAPQGVFIHAEYAPSNEFLDQYVFKYFNPYPNVVFDMNIMVKYDMGIDPTYQREQFAESVSLCSAALVDLKNAVGSQSSLTSTVTTSVKALQQWHEKCLAQAPCWLHNSDMLTQISSLDDLIYQMSSMTSTKYQGLRAQIKANVTSLISDLLSTSNPYTKAYSVRTQSSKLGISRADIVFRV